MENEFNKVFDKACFNGFFTSSNESQIEFQKSIHNIAFNDWLKNKYNIIQLTEDNYKSFCTDDNFLLYLDDDAKNQQELYYSIPQIGRAHV